MCISLQLCVYNICMCSSTWGGHYRPPPQGVSVGGEVLVVLLLHLVHEEGGEDQDQEPNVPRSHQLL